MKLRQECYDILTKHPYNNGEIVFYFQIPNKGIFLAEFNILSFEDQTYLFTATYSIAEDNTMEIKIRSNKRCLNFTTNHTQKDISYRIIGDYLFVNFDDFLHLLSVELFQVVNC